MSRKININTAGTADLSKLPGIGTGLAERIVKYRQEVGPFRTLGELGAVSGVGDDTLARITSRISLADGEEEAAQLPPATVRVVMAGEQQSGYGSHRLFALFTRRELIDLYNGSKTSLWVPGQLVAEIPRSGELVLSFPNRADLQDTVVFRVYAPDGELLNNTSMAAEKLPEKIELKVAPKSYGTIERNTDPDFGKPTRLKGRVIDAAGRRQAANTQVVIWAADKDEPQAADFRALMVAETDAMGHFSGPWPRGRFTSAHGAVALGAREPVNVPIHLERDNSFPETVLLPVEMEAAPIEDKSAPGCGCAAGEAVPRDPDMADLTRADGMYSTDPGAGRCVDFTKPDRTLEEFTYSYVVRTTEPLIKGLTLKEPTKIDISAIAGLLVRQQSQQRSVLTAAASTATEMGDGEPLLMMKAANLPQLPTDRIDAKVLQALARDPDGFSLTQVAHAANLTLHGDILRIIGQTIGRQPGRAKLTGEQPVDWDDEPTIFQATSIAHGHVLRFKQEWVADGYSMGNLLYSLPLAPGQKKQIAVVDWERRESAGRTEALTESESLEAMVSRDRDINEIVNATVNESVRGGSSSSSGSFAAGLGIGAIIPPVGGLIGIGGGTSSASTSAWQNASRGTAANALNQLRDRTVQSASAVRSQRSSVVTTVRQGERVMATTETVANYNHCHAITIQYFEVLRHMLVRQRLTDVQECLFVPLMMSRFTADKTLRWRNTLAGAVADRKLRAGFDALERIANHYVGSDFPTGTYADQLVDHIEGDLTLRFELARPKDKDDGFDASTWGFLSHLLPSVSPADFYKQYLKDQAFKDRIFQQELAPRIARAFVQALRFNVVSPANFKTALPVDATLVPDFVNDRPMYVSLRLASTLPALPRKQIQYIEISDISGVLNLPFFHLLPAGSRVMVESANIRYRTRYSSGHLVRDGRVMNDLVGGDTVRMFTPLTSGELRNPREEDKELSRRLLDHLNENIERYHHALWWRMSPDRRYMLLDGFEAPGSGGRSVASVVENELIGIVGNSLIMPVARGFHLDPTFRQDAREPVDLIEHYQPGTPIEPSRIAIPTRGVYAEAVMGACNSCETKEEQRFWRWEESPIPDAPPAILPTSTDTRRAEPPDMTAKGFPAPIIAMQSAPAAPDPTGLAAAMNLLGTPNLFKDITGLEGTQRNAAEALKGAFDTAQFFGGKAADLALQGKMNKDIDKAMRTIQNAKESGLINNEQASQLTENAIRGLIGSGSTEQTRPMSREDVQQVTDTAGQNKAAVRVSRPTGERVEVDARKQEGMQDQAAAVQVSVTGSTGSADNRAFRPSARDSSGVIDLEAQVRNAPPGASSRWDPVDPAAVAIVNPASNRTRVRALRPGRTQVDFIVYNASGAQIATNRVQLSAPQFVRVTEDAAAFDGVLADLQLTAVKAGVIEEARRTCEHLVRNANVRMVWQMGPFSETMPAHVPAAHVTVATFRGEPPAARPTLLGQTVGVGGDGGAGVLNETIDLFPGAYDNPTGGAQVYDVDAETQALVQLLKAQAVSDPVMEAFAVKVYGRLMGETLAHEIVHSLLWDEVPSGHNEPAIPNDLMNRGAERSFRQRTGLQGPMVSPVDPAAYVDHGLAGIGGLQATNQALVNSHFPVPPAFA